MQGAVPWPVHVSPEFRDALTLATQRHLAQPATAPRSPHQLLPLEREHSPLLPSSTPSSSPRVPSPVSIPRSASLMMKTRVAVRDKMPHRFQVIPLREAAKNRDTSGTKQFDGAKQPTATWTRTVKVLRPSGTGLGLNVPAQIQSPSTADVPERGRERTPRGLKAGGASVARKGIFRALQGLSPTRLGSSPDHKENRKPARRDRTGSPTTRRRRLREYTLAHVETSDLASDATSMPIRHPGPVTFMSPQDTAPQSTQENTATDIPQTSQSAVSAQPSARGIQEQEDITITYDTLAAARDLNLDVSPRFKSPENTTSPVRVSRHFKSPSFNAIHHLLSASTPASDLPDDKPRVRCRKRTNTLSVGLASTKRYGVYTPAELDFSAIVPQMSVGVRPTSTYSLDALLSAYSCDSLASMYSQESFEEQGTRPLRVQARTLQGRGTGGHSHAIVLELIREVDTAIGEWLN